MYHNRMIRYVFLVIALFLLPIADTFGGILRPYFPLSLVLRLAVYLFAVWILLTTHVVSKQIRLFLLFIFLYILIDIILHFYFFLDINVLKVELPAAVKLLYFPVFLLTFLVLVKEGVLNRSNIVRSITFFGILILCSLIIGNLTGLGASIAGRGTNVVAEKGFMIGANEVGLMLLLTVSFVASFFNAKLPKWMPSGGLLLIIYLWAGLLVFTKSALIASVVAVVVVLSNGLSHNNKLVRLFYFSIGLLGTFAASFFIIKYVDFIISSLRSTFFSVLFNEGLIAFLFRGRDGYIHAIYPQLINFDYNYLFLLFGAGENYIRKVSLEPLGRVAGDGTMFEMDFFDLLGSFGILGTGLYFLLLGVLIKAVAPIGIHWVIKFVFILLFAHSFMAGHVVYSPQVTTIVSFILILHSSYLVRKCNLGRSKF